MKNLAKANSFTWMPDWNDQPLDIEVSHFDEEDRGPGYPSEHECRMVKLTIKELENGRQISYCMGPRDVETMVETLEKLMLQ